MLKNLNEGATEFAEEIKNITVEEILDDFPEDIKKQKYQKILLYVNRKKIAKINFRRAKDLILKKGDKGQVLICDKKKCVSIGEYAELMQILEVQ